MRHSSFFLSEWAAWLFIAFAVLMFPCQNLEGAQAPKIKKVQGKIIDVVAEEGQEAQVAVEDKKARKHAFLLLEQTEIKRLEDLAQVQPGEMISAVIDESGGEKRALLLTVGKIQKGPEVDGIPLKLNEDQLPYAVPELPTQMPPLPKMDAQTAASAKGGPGGASPEMLGAMKTPKDKGKKEEKEKSKDPFEDVLSEEPPLSVPPPLKPPTFIRGKILNIELSGGKKELTLQDEQGNPVQIRLSEASQTATRYLEASELHKGDPVRVSYEKKGGLKLAREILVQKSVSSNSALAREDSPSL